MTKEDTKNDGLSTASVADLNKSITLLNKRLTVLTSYKQSFGLYLIRGIAFTIGASIIAGVMIASSAQFIQTVEDVPILNKLVDTVVIQEVIRQYELSQQNGGL